MRIRHFPIGAAVAASVLLIAAPPAVATTNKAPTATATNKAPTATATNKAPTATATNKAPVPVDVGVTVMAEGGDSPVAPGGVIEFTVSTSCCAGQPAVTPQHRTVVLQLSDHLRIRSAESEFNAGPCVPNAVRSAVTCTLTEPLELPQQADLSWRVQVTVADNAPLGEYVSATARLFTELPDPNPANNIASGRVFVSTGGDMSVAIAAPDGPWPVGSTFKAQIRVHNAGPHGSPGWLMTDISPGSLKTTGWPSGGVCGADPGTMECLLGVVPAGGTFVINLTVTVPGEVGNGRLVLRPEIVPVAPDSNAGNNVATYQAEIVSREPAGDGSDEPTLPITGAPVGPLGIAGLALLLAGSGMLLLTRRRRRTA
jgi:LPXTG-motif cell wall-anchored protein